MIDLDRYLERIGLHGRPGLDAIHRAHATSIPFENLDPWAGRPVSIDVAAIEKKLVAERRGGYCFEHNLLLAAALTQSGIAVDTLLGRVRIGGWPGPIRPRTHLALRAWVDDRPWLADVGFAMAGLLDPLPFAAGRPHEQSGWLFRLIADGDELVLQTGRDGTWTDQYGVIATPVPFVDVETSNWMACTHPDSPFIRGPMLSAIAADGRRTLIRTDADGGYRLIEQTPAHRETTTLSDGELDGVLRDRFGLERGTAGASA